MLSHRIPIKITITGGAGRIGYALAQQIADGSVFGAKQPIELTLLELPSGMDKLRGIATELEDCAFPSLQKLTLTDDITDAMRGANWVVLVGGRPRGPGMESKDLIMANGPIFVDAGRAINAVAAPNVRVQVVANPCNTNCLIAMHNAPDVPRERFQAMMRLDHNRARRELAQRIGCSVGSVKKMAIWGNHDPTMVPDYLNCTVDGKPVTEIIDDLDWLRHGFVEAVRNRGKLVIDRRGKSSAISAAVAVVSGLRSLVNVTPYDNCFTAGVISDGNPYGIPDGLICGFPCHSNGEGDWEIAPGFRMDDELEAAIARSVQSLVDEREMVKDLLIG